MASLSTFGNTLTDLQAGMNAAQGLEYQRSNFQNQIHAQQMADQLRARSEAQKTQAQRDENMARIIESRNMRNQQGRQFDAEMKNRLDLGRLDAESRKEVATIGAGARTMDPRFAQTIADIQAANNEKQNDVAYNKKLSDQRKAAVAARDQIKKNRGFFDWGEPNDPQWKQLNDMIAQMDAQAITLGIAPAADGGYVVPDFTPIPVPAMLNPNLPGAGVSVRPGVSSVSPFEPSLFSGGSFVLDPANPASPSRPAVIPDFSSYSNGQPYEWNFAPPVAPPVARRIKVLPDGRTVMAP